MTLFVDASVLVAILTQEADADSLIERLDQHGGPFLASPIVRLEASLSLARRMAAAKAGPATAEMIERSKNLVDQMLDGLQASEVVISQDVAEHALRAAGRFGKMVGHPARLNMGDCLAYACAAASGAHIAYKGDDFSHTDLGW